ncbi:3-hydroxybutyryl-CoA dehydratase [Pseudomaricurvus alkylphenolicus]|jgi:enoyl-CoA hydratase/carnithine racemase|uniref:enoyl-CoA hydratase-related protein n=1 Tax=Pseudomaricurvus alkylphenolicus TaxID=1306991 RepID=UPI001424A560|nr:enoyl-CoA hydratase-related protein [Pseudomaricurvus alkylphenolicus]NIB38735.1 3-hydroxybutyryl-CoA dehydratase [Pseudomaricurvus alkylphenolicus]
MNEILISVAEGIARVTLNRPQQKNCVTLSMWRQIKSVMEELGSDDTVRVVTLAGAGGNFCSGADISEFGEVRSTEQQVHHYEQAVDAASDAIMECPKPVIAAVEGYCVGGGLGLAMACDFRVAAPGACLFIPAARMSIVYGLRETQNLLALVGLTWAKRILYTGERLNANLAYQVGLIDELTEENGFESALQVLAVRLTESAPLTIAGSKAILNSLEITANEQVVEAAEALIKAAGESQDYHEGRQAFAEKRTPRFIGR